MSMDPHTYQDLSKRWRKAEIVAKRTLERAIKLAEAQLTFAVLANDPDSYRGAIRNVVKQLEAEIRFPLPEKMKSRMCKLSSGRRARERGKTRLQVRRIARRLGIKYVCSFRTY